MTLHCRQLWCTCNRPGREVGHLLLYGIADITSQASREGGAGCGRADLINIRDTIREGHQQVTGLKVIYCCDLIEKSLNEKVAKKEK